MARRRGTSFLRFAVALLRPDGVLTQKFTNFQQECCHAGTETAATLQVTAFLRYYQQTPCRRRHFRKRLSTDDGCCRLQPTDGRQEHICTRRRTAAAAGRPAEHVTASARFPTLRIAEGREGRKECHLNGGAAFLSLRSASTRGLRRASSGRRIHSRRNWASVLKNEYRWRKSCVRRAETTDGRGQAERGEGPFAPSYALLRTRLSPSSPSVLSSFPRRQQWRRKSG